MNADIIIAAVLDETVASGAVIAELKIGAVSGAGANQIEPSGSGTEIGRVCVKPTDGQRTEIDMKIARITKHRSVDTQLA